MATERFQEHTVALTNGAEVMVDRGVESDQVIDAYAYFDDVAHSPQMRCIFDTPGRNRLFIHASNPAEAEAFVNLNAINPDWRDEED